MLSGDTKKVVNFIAIYKFLHHIKTASLSPDTLVCNLGVLADSGTGVCSVAADGEIVTPAHRTIHFSITPERGKYDYFFRFNISMLVLTRYCNKHVPLLTHTLILKCMHNTAHAWLAHALNITMRSWSP